MRIIVSGSSGFIGSHIVDKLVDLDYQVIALDKDKSLYENQKATYIYKDIEKLNPEESLKFFTGVDAIIHCAAQVDVRNSIAFPTYDAQQNIINTLKLLEATVKAGIKKFIFSSSAGAIDNGNPASPYGIAKLSIEYYLKFFNDHYGLETTSLRYSNVYGSRQKTGVIPIFANRLLEKQALIINGGNQTRDFIHVNDVVQSNIEALTAPCDVYTIATGNSIDVNELINLMYVEYSKLVSTPTLTKTYLPQVKGEVMESNLTPYFPNNYTPKVSLEQGLRDTILYNKNIKEELGYLL